MKSILTPNITPRKRTLPSGFTLIELLVTISIIGILATLVLPAVSKMKKGALSARCIGNLRQIGIAMNAYAASNDGQLPIDWTAAKDSDGSQTWVQRLTPYLQNANTSATTWVCPDARLKPSIATSGNWVSTYSMHPRLGAESPEYRIRRVGLSNHSEVILVADAVQNPNNKNLAPVSFFFPEDFKYVSSKTMESFIDSADGQQGGLSYHHPNKTAHALMVDGSVRGFKQGTVQKKNAIATGG